MPHSTPTPRRSSLHPGTLAAACALCALLAGAPSALADDAAEPTQESAAPLGAGALDAQEAEQLCESFAQAVETHRDDCAAMGTAMGVLVDANWRGLQRMAVAELDAELEAACLARVEPAIGPLMACIDNDDVGAAMRRLKALHAQAVRAAAAPPGDSDDEATVGPP